MSKSEDRSHGQAEGITRTCAVLRVRGKGSEVKRPEKAAKRSDPGKAQSIAEPKGKVKAERATLTTRYFR